VIRTDGPLSRGHEAPQVWHCSPTFRTTRDHGRARIQGMPLPTVDMPAAPWTYDLEIALFKAIMSYRPVGIHKSLRLISILNAVNTQYPSTDPPITLQDIKNKLDELYDIPGIEDQEEIEEAATEDSSNQSKSQQQRSFTEFQLPFEDVVSIIEERGKGIDGDGSSPSSPEAQMSVRSGRSGRGTKRRREESTTAVSVTDAGTEEEGTIHHRHGTNWEI
jgi:hypothetical protein